MMIGLLILAVLADYIILSIIVISVVYKKTINIKKMFIALVIMVLIPTWDVILGYPIYKFLCATQAGVHIYKTVDNVEGFYVGEKSQRHKPHIPYDGYKYIDYKEMNHYKPTGKYYRSYWIDSNNSQECIKPRYPDSPYDEYTKAFKGGKCIVEKEIPKKEVSRWFSYYGKYEILYKIPILKFRIYRIIEYKDRKTGKLMADAIRVWWQGGWVYGILSSIEVGSGGVSCDGNVNLNKLDYKIFKIKEGK